MDSTDAETAPQPVALLSQEQHTVPQEQHTVSQEQHTVPQEQHTVPAPDERTHNSRDASPSSPVEKEQTSQRKCQTGPQTKGSSSKHTPYQARTVLRAFGGHVVFFLSYLKERLRVPKSEPKKVAIYHSRHLFFFQALIHLIPAGICAGLTAMNFKGIFLGRDLPGIVGHTEPKQFGIQVAAKLTELLAVASLASFVFALVRHDMTSRRGVPFAAVSAGIQFSSLAYLWSVEFWALLFAPSRSVLRRTWFFALLGLCTILATLIGPSTAILLEPRMGYWPCGGTDVWMNTSAETIFPPVLDETAIQDTGCEVYNGNNHACPAAQWDTLRNWITFLYYNDHRFDNPSKSTMMPFGGLNMYVMDVKISPWLQNRPHVPNPDPRFLVSLIMIPHVALTRAIMSAGMLWNDALIRALQVGESRLFYRMRSSTSLIYLNPTLRTLCNATTYHSPPGKACVLLPRTTFDPADVLEVCDNDQISQWVEEDYDRLADNHLSLRWIDGSLEGANNIGLELDGGFGAAALISVPDPKRKQLHVLGCSMNLNYSVLNTKLEGPAVSIDPFPDYSMGYSPDLPPGYVSEMKESWLKYVNPTIRQREGNTTVFEEMAITAGVWRRGDDKPPPYENRFEAILLLMIGNGLARIDPWAGPQGTLKNWGNGTEYGPWWRELVPCDQAYGWGGNAYNLTAEQERQYLKAHVNMRCEGYAYAYFGSGTKFFSVFVCLAYVAVATTLCSITLCRGSYTSTSWTSATELNALALGSEPLLHEFENTSAGIYTLKPLKQAVRVRPKDRRVQIVAANGDGDDHSKLLANTQY